MITEFIEKPIKLKHAEIPCDLMRIFERYYKKGDMQFCADLMGCAMQLYSYGEFHTDDDRVVDALDVRYTEAHDKVKNYVERIKSTQNEEIAQDSLDEIADLYKEGKKQQEIADIMTARGIKMTQSTVSRRLKRIREDFPQLLE